MILPGSTPEGQGATPVYLTPDEIRSLLMQHKDRNLSNAEVKLAGAYVAATGKDI